MGGQSALTDYVESAIARSNFTKLRDGTYACTIPECPGVVSFGTDLITCRDELRSTIEYWVMISLKLGHNLLANIR